MLPMNVRTVALSSAVLQQFRTHENFERGTAQTVGALFGRLDSDEVVSVHYAPPLLMAVPEYELVNAYAVGRVEASSEAAWHLRGWIGMGYWIAHDWPELEPQRLMRILETHARTVEPPLLTELVLVILLRMPDGLIEIHAQTYVSRESLSTWRRLELIDLANIPLQNVQEGQ